MPVVLITGCSAGGIGHHLAQEFTARGCSVWATARRVESMADLEPLGVKLLAMDVTDKQQIASCVVSTLRWSMTHLHSVRQPAAPGNSERDCQSLGQLPAVEPAHVAVTQLPVVEGCFTAALQHHFKHCS
jgi:NAD(P)-dependent dehydrogenase (short-subunit alcohol dehydrogenase family)